MLSKMGKSNYYNKSSVTWRNTPLKVANTEVFKENTILQEIVALTACESHWEICHLVSDICSEEGSKKIC